MAESQYTAPATYTITFPSLSEAEVNVSVNGVKLPTSDYSIANYSTSGSGTVTITATVNNGDIVRVYRDTDISTPEATFAAGASIAAADLNNNNLQLRYKLQEKAVAGDISTNAITTDAIRDSAVTTDKINDLAVTTEKLADGAVTNPKLADNSVSLAKMQDDSVGTDELIDAAVTTAKLADGAVTNVKLADNSVSLQKMQDDSVDTAEIVDSAVITEKLATDAVTQAKIADDAVGTAEIIDLNVTTAKLADSAVTTVKIADDAVTSDKLAAGSVTNDAIGDGTISGAKIQDGTLDIQSVLAVDFRTLAEQNAQPDATGYDDEIGSTAANDKRYDIIYQSGTPSGTDWTTGKLWYDHADDQTLSIWNGSAWLGISSGGTFLNQPTVIWVDSVSGSDSNDGHRIIDPMKTIKAAVASADNGDVILVNPGVYRETAPIDITVNNLSIIGQSLRSCFIHPTPATEENSLFRVNSGTQIANFTISGLKASGTRGGHSIDTDSTYGLPTNQAFVAEFYPNAVIYKSPYIQNCTNFADSGIFNHTEAEYNANNGLGGFFNPNNVNQGGFGGDLTSGPTGGGLLVDGSAVSSSSPLRSMVVDSFTQVTLDGPGILCCNNGYAQLVSFFGTFCHYHAKALNGGQLNLSNCTTDYGRYGLIADGKSTTANFTASVTATAAAGDITFTIGAPTAGTGWYGSATRPQDNMSVTIGSNTYPVRSAVANGSGWDVTIENPDPNANATNLGLNDALAVNDTASFFNRSYISTGGHTFEYVGAGTDYNAAPENGGVAVESNQVKNLNGGKVFQSSTDHNGKFKVGDTFVVNQRTGEIDISLDAYRPEVVNDLSPQLGADLDVNGFDIVSVSNGNIDITPNGTGEVVLSTASVSDLTDGRVVLAGTSGSLEDNSNLTFNGSTLTTTGLTASGTVSLSGITYPTADGNQNQVIITDGSGTLSFESVANLTGSGLQDVVDDTTPQLGGDLDVNGNTITSASNGNVVIDPNGTGIVNVSSSSLFVDSTGNGTVNIVSTNNQTSAGNKIAFFGANRFDADEEMAYIKPLLTGNSGGAGNVQTGHLTFGTSGSERLRIDSSGNVGIGESSPSANLHVSADNPQIRLQDSDQTNKYFQLTQISGTAYFDVRNDTSNGTLLFRGSNGTTTSEYARFVASGRFGLGETSPDYKLHITVPTAEAITAKLANGADTNFELAAANGPSTNTSGTEVSRFGINYNGTGWNSYLQFIRGGGATTGEIAVVTSQSEALRIDSDGNVGVGTSSPGALLDVNGGSLIVQNSSGNTITLGTTVGNGNDSTFILQKARGGTGSIAEVQNGDDLGTIQWQGYYSAAYQANSTIRAEAVIDGSYSDKLLYDSDTHVIRTSNTDRVTVNSSGNVLIGDTTGSERLRVVGTTQDVMRLKTSAVNAKLYLEASATSANTYIQATNDDILFVNNGGVKMRVRSGGGISFGSDSASSNALDDYEEGTWTPALSPASNIGATYTTQTGTYTKIGNRVTCSGRIKLEAITGSGGSPLFVIGLPFNPNVNYDAGVVGDAINFGSIYPTALLSNTSTNGFQLRAIDGTQGSSNVTINHLTNTSEFEFTVSYRVQT